MISPSLANKQVLLRERQAKHKAREKEKHMGKNNRKEVAKRLTEEILKTEDPAMVVELSRQLAKVLPKKSTPRKPVDKPKKIHSSILDVRTGSAVDDLADWEKVRHHLVVQIEKRQRDIGRELTHAELVVFGEEVTKNFSEREAAALEAWNVALAQEKNK